MISSVTCPAPITAILIDTNKGVRPCCTYYGNYLGNIKDERLVDIINGEEWTKLKQSMWNMEWPDGCLNCKEREEVTNFSVRNLFRGGTFDITGWEEKVTYLELNGSNICNLACLHCSPGFSSKWVIESAKVRKVFDKLDNTKKQNMDSLDCMANHSDDIKGRSTKMHLPNPELVVENLRQIDLTGLRTINFKGGEPLLNSETLAVLHYLQDQSILKNVHIIFSSNGTYMNQEIIDVLGKCKSVAFNISLDGIGELFNYIRYGDLKFESIEPVVAQLNQLANIYVEFQASVMNYNIYRLAEIKEWVMKMVSKYKIVREYTGFSNCVQSPNYLSLQTLSDTTRIKLAEYYRQFPSNYGFTGVISTLTSHYAGDSVHNKWVGYTELMQTVRNNNILDIVPELEHELKYV